MPDILNALSIISHEFKTPLSTISSSAELIQKLSEKSMLTDEIVQSYMTSIRYHCKRLELLTENVLAASQSESGYMSCNYTSRTLDAFFDELIGTLNLFANMYSFKAEFIDKTGGEEFCCDYHILSHIVMNLVSNAIKYNDKNVKEIKITAREDGRFVYLSIKDNGIGIPEDKLDRIYDRFYRVDNNFARKVGGTGLGLTIVHNFVHALDAKIEVKSKPRKGTEFILALPKGKEPTFGFRGEDKPVIEKDCIAMYLSMVSDYSDIIENGIDWKY